MADKDRANINGSQGTSEEHRLLVKTHPMADDIEITESENSWKFENSKQERKLWKRRNLGSC